MNRLAILATAVLAGLPAIAEAHIPPTPASDLVVQRGQPCAVGRARDAAQTLGDTDTDQWIIRKLAVLVKKPIPRVACPGEADTPLKRALVHKAATDAVLMLVRR